MVAAAILKIAFLVITHRPIVRFQRNFVRGSRTACRQGDMTKSANFLNPRWRTTAILKIVKSPYLSSKLSPFENTLNRHIWLKNSPILMKFGTLQQLLNLITVMWPKMWNFKIQDGGCRHLEKRFFGYNSSTNCPISAKFCMKKLNGMSTRATWQKLHILKI